MSASFTPGPWVAEWKCKVDDDGLWVGDGISIESATTLTSVVFVQNEHGEGSGNARLIAAAPELLAACRSLVADDLTADQLHNRISAARAAIAKATGGQP